MKKGLRPLCKGLSHDLRERGWASPYAFECTRCPLVVTRMQLQASYSALGAVMEAERDFAIEALES